jgi:peptidyl-prolyl cis-trans isomerase D
MTAARPPLSPPLVEFEGKIYYHAVLHFARRQSVLKFMRKKRRSFFIIIAFFAIIVVFVFWGVGPGPEKEGGIVAKVGRVKIPYKVYDDLYRGQIDYYKGVLGENFSEKVIEELDLKRKTLDALIEKTLVLEAARKEGIKVTKDDVRKAILSVAAFQQDGVFDKNLYFAVLARNRIAPADFEASVEEDLLIGRMRDKVARGVSVSAEEIKRGYERENRRISLEYAELDSERLLDAATVSEEEAKKFYEKNRQLFMTAARIKVVYATIGKNAFLKAIKVKPEDVKKHYERNIVYYELPAQFKARHILVKPGEDTARLRAENILKELKAGADFSELAKKFSQDPGTAGMGGDLGWFAAGAMVRPFEEALFKLKKGEISPVVETEYGFHIIRLDDLKEARTAGFEEKRAEIEKALAAELAEKEARARIAEVHAVFKGTAPIESIKKEAEKKGARVRATGLFTEKDSNEITKEERLSDAVFTLKKGETSGIIETERDFHVAKVLERSEAEPAPFETLKGAITVGLKKEKAKDIAAKKAEELVKRVSAGERFAEVAAKEGYKTGVTTFFDMSTAVIPSIGAAAEPALFDMKKGDVYEKALPYGGKFYALRLRDSKEAPPEGLEKKRFEIEGRLLQKKREETLVKWVETLKNDAKIKIYEEAL